MIISEKSVSVLHPRTGQSHQRQRPWTDRSLFTGFSHSFHDERRIRFYLDRFQGSEKQRMSRNIFFKYFTVFRMDLRAYFQCSDSADITIRLFNYDMEGYEVFVFYPAAVSTRLIRIKTQSQISNLKNRSSLLASPYLTSGCV